MLTKPNHGWTDFQLEGQVYSLSYLTSIPMEWLDRAIFGLESGQEFSVRAMLEPGELRCIVTKGGSSILTEAGEVRSRVGTMEFCRRLHRDLTAFPEEWAAFGGVTVPELQRKLNQLARLLK